MSEYADKRYSDGEPLLINAGVTAHDDYLITQALNNLQEVFENVQGESA